MDRNERDASGEAMPWILFIVIASIFFLSGHDLYWTWKETPALSGEVVQAVGTGTLGARVGYLLLGLVSLYGVTKRHPVRFDPLLTYLLAVFALWATVSVLWAGDQFLATRRITATWLYCLAAFMCARRFSGRGIIVFAFFTTAANFLVALVVELTLRTFTPGFPGYRFAGTQHPNLLAMCLALLVVSSVAIFDDSRNKKALMISSAGISFLFLLLTKSRTSLLSVILALAVYAFVRGPRKLLLSVLPLSASGIIAVFLLLPDELSQVLFLGRPLQEIGTLTDRLPLWGALLGYVQKEPFLGYGFNAFWTESTIHRIETLTGWTVLHSHNTFIELLLGLGPIGLLLYVLFVAASTFKAYRLATTMNSGLYAFCLAILVFYWTVMPVESMLFKFTLPNFICFVVMLRLAFFETKLYASSSVKGGLSI